MVRKYEEEIFSEVLTLEKGVPIDECLEGVVTALLSCTAK